MSMTRSRAYGIRGHIRIRNGIAYSWITDYDGKTLVTDNVGVRAWQKLAADCAEDVACFRRVALCGHVFTRSYTEIVESEEPL